MQAILKLLSVKYQKTAWGNKSKKCQFLLQSSQISLERNPEWGLKMYIYFEFMEVVR